MDEQLIIGMIRQADDAGDRAVLTIMLEFARSLHSNTEATQAIADGFKAHAQRFEDHVAEEMALFQQGRGMYRALAWSAGVLGVIGAALVALGVYIFLEQAKVLSATISMNVEQDRRISIMETQMNEIGRRVGDIERTQRMPGP